MWTRRQFMIRGFGTGISLSALGLAWHGWAQDENLTRGMITPATQEAIDSGINYLVANQHADGSWGTGQHTGNVAITALGGLALMSAGYQPGRGRHGDRVTRALRYVLQNEDPATPGFLVSRRGTSFHGPMYGHGFATLFLAEVYGMVQEPALQLELRNKLSRAINLIVTSQNSEGGWRYRPVRNDADISVTICQIMALRAARNAGIAVPKRVADDCIKYVKECQDSNSGGFFYQRRAGQPGFARTAAGVVALYSAGLYSDPSVDRGLEYLMRFKPGNAQGAGILGGLEQQMHYFYGHYYAVQAMWIRGGEYWRQWYPAIRDELLRSRRPDGSWNVGVMCAHYNTAMALIILQVPNQYLPIIHR